MSNVGGAAVLAADACARYGLTVHQFSAETRRRLHGPVPPGGAVSGPVNTTTAISEISFRICLELASADAGVDAILALILPTAATGDLVTAVRAADVRVPMAAVVLNQAETVRLLPRATDDGLSGSAAEPTSIPAYSDAEAAARALARAAAYGLWRAQPTGQLREFSDVAGNQARDLTQAFLCRSPDGGWLSPGETATLLGCYHIPVGSPGPPTQPEGTGGTEIMIGIAQEPVFGPVITFGTGGPDAGALANRAARLVPLTDADADELIRSIRTPPLLPGHDAAEPAGLAALPDILLRVSRLADDLPEIAELDLNPVTVRPDGMAIEQARIRLAPARRQDPFLRKLR